MGREFPTLDFGQAIGSLAVLWPGEIGHAAAVAAACTFVDVGGAAVAWRLVELGLEYGVELAGRCVGRPGGHNEQAGHGETGRVADSTHAEILWRVGGHASPPLGRSIKHDPVTPLTGWVRRVEEYAGRCGLDSKRGNFLLQRTWSALLAPGAGCEACADAHRAKLQAMGFRAVSEIRCIG
jgi:hypothetical protein